MIIDIHLTSRPAHPRPEQWVCRPSRSLRTVPAAAFSPASCQQLGGAFLVVFALPGITWSYVWCSYLGLLNQKLIVLVMHNIAITNALFEDQHWFFRVFLTAAKVLPTPMITSVHASLGSPCIGVEPGSSRLGSVRRVT